MIRIKNKGVHDLFLAISNMKTLSTFDFICKLRKPTYTRTTNELLKRLFALNMHFPRSEAPQIKGKKSLSPDASSPLCLTFFSKHNVTSQEIPSLSYSLTNTKSLSTLILDFANLGRIDDIGMQLLSEGLKTLATLSTLELKFYDCSLISDNGCLSLSSSLVELKMLTSLSLHFHNCKILTDEALGHLGTCLKPLNLTTLLSLEFSSCKLFTEKGMETLVDGFKHMSHLVQSIAEYLGDLFSQ